LTRDRCLSGCEDIELKYALVSKIARVKEENTASRKSIVSGNQKMNGQGRAWRSARKEETGKQAEHSRWGHVYTPRSGSRFARGSISLIGYTSCMVGLKMTVRKKGLPTPATLHAPGFCMSSMQLGLLYVHGPTWRGTARLQNGRREADNIGADVRTSQNPPTASNYQHVASEQ
jgi:hypothetical protein